MTAVYAGATVDHTTVTALTEQLTGTGETVVIAAPQTGEPITTVPTDTAEDVEAAAERAQAAQQSWGQVAPEQRAAVLDRFGRAVLEDHQRLIDLLQLETGKARQHAREELLDTPLTTTYYASRGPPLLRPESRAAPIPVLTEAIVEYEPVGVVGVIAPWNYPMTLAMADVLPALLAGNAVVCKPDERTPLTVLALRELLVEAGLPSDVFQIVLGPGEPTGTAVIDAVDYIAFTGGTETGRLVGERAGRNLIDASLELGGNNPALVLGDASPRTAARGITQAAVANAGQLCLAPERVYVLEDQYAAVVEALRAEFTALSLGAGYGYEYDVGTLIDAAHREHVAAVVDDAVGAGATVHAGGTARPELGPAYYEPTLLTDVPPSATVADEETFGPVLSVWPVPDVKTAIERANDTPYGLNASVWTGDEERGRAVASQLDCGTVCVNDGFFVGWGAIDAPMGGMGDSGVGRRHGPEGVYRYLETRTVATAKLGPIVLPEWVPTRAVTAGIDLLTRAQRRFL